MAINPVFSPASAILLDTIKTNNEKLKPTFLIPTKFISEEAAQVGYLLNEILNFKTGEKKNYRSFFCNSSLEAIHGTLKILRHFNKLNRSHAKGTILIYDPFSQLLTHMNPLNRKESEALVPGIQFESNLSSLSSLLAPPHSFEGFIFIAKGPEEAALAESLFTICHRRGIVTAYSEANFSSWSKQTLLYQFNHPPDVYINGENLTHYQVPFGVFSMSDRVYSAWNNSKNCLLHSSTYSGNLLALSVVLKILLQDFPSISPYDVRNRKAVVKGFANYINPYAAYIYQTLQLSPYVKTANGLHLSILDRANALSIVLDCVGNSGCNLRGHNPQDIIPEVIDNHDIQHNYWSDLSAKLSLLTHLQKALPAISGASAVEIAITLALAASEEKTRILTFTDNYSGKTLVSLSVTDYEGYKKPFQPLYYDVISINPFLEGAKKLLIQELSSGKIALVWFELLQGDTLQTIPNDILDIVSENKDKQGYFIGIDEILTGTYRTGSFLLSQTKKIKPDLITLSKGISDMTFPISVVMANQVLYNKAYAKHEALIKRLETYYIHQLGSHIALHGLQKYEKEQLSQNALQIGQYLKKKLSSLVNICPFIEEIRGEGLLLYLKVNKNTFPINIFGEDLFNFLLSSYLLEKGQVFLFCNRLTPPTNLSLEEADKIYEKISHCLKKTTPWKLARFCLKKIMTIYIRTFCYKILSKLQR